MLFAIILIMTIMFIAFSLIFIGFLIIFSFGVISSIKNREDKKIILENIFGIIIALAFIITLIGASIILIYLLCTL